MVIKKLPFLRDYQQEAVSKMRNGCILHGGVGSGKSRTGLYYYFEMNGGSMIPNHIPMKGTPQDLYIITTAMKRDSEEWEEELSHYNLSSDPLRNAFYGNKIVIDSWNNIGKYIDITGAFFIFDEDRVTGKGAWVKSFLKITKKNEWIILSATPGDTWMDYVPVFIANGFYKNRTEFNREHVVFSRFTKWPQVDKYINTQKLIRLRDKILVDMNVREVIMTMPDGTKKIIRKTTPHHYDIWCDFNIPKYKQVLKTRWNPYTDQPLEQASQVCYVLRRIVNEDESRVVALMDLLEKIPKSIIFYNFDYEREMLLHLFSGEGRVDDPYVDYDVAEWSGHAHQPIPNSDRWIYLVQYTAGCEGWNCIKTDTIIFFSQNYSYKVMAQAEGRINRMNTPFTDLYYYHLKSKSGIDAAISRALKQKKKFNERSYIHD